MDDPVDRLIVERQGMEAGFPGSVVLSIVAHVLIASAAIAAPFVFPHGPLLQVAPGFAVVLPRGGGGSSAPPAAPARTPEAPPTAAPPEPPPPDRTKVAQPPKDEPRTGLPELDTKPRRRKPEAQPLLPSRGAATSGREAAGGARAGTGTSSRTPGLEFGPPGVGVPEGTDTGGDWYMAGVQQKIWMLWTQELRAGFSQPIGVSFTILADGSVTDIRVTQSCGAPMLDLAALRAVTSAGPFGPLPKDYGTDRKTIQAVFKPTS